jgi:Rad3-related DNA helicase
MRKWLGEDVKKMGDEVREWQRALKNEQVVENLRAEVRTCGMELVHLGRKATKEHVAELHKLEATLQKCERISGMQDDWVCEKREGTRWGRQWSFDVIWPGRYAEQYLFCNVEKVVVMSATLRPKTMSLLGVKGEDYEFREWQRIFPANRHPIYSSPARYEDKDVRVDRRTTDRQLQAWVDHIDHIIEARLDRKGIIQTVSYDRQRFLMDHSRFRDHFMGNTNDPESDSASEVAEAFRKASAPKILVSPSFSTGWDFPGSECEYVVICKVPFKPNQGKVQKAREERDEKYGAYLAMIEMVQASGRGMRSSEDRCEVFIVDGHCGWFMAQNKFLAPEWFVRGVRKVAEVPQPPEKLPENNRKKSA